ncbi:MAG: sigma 54-interacting transcriptional regulator [Deltaproteobacteria bacterium]|nr:sigma 54-interacting transcriptional regulator [Deltaproteobacteria bacterium]
MPSSKIDTEQTETASSHRKKQPEESRLSILWLLPQYGIVTEPDGHHLIGRDKSCDTQLPGTKISRKHALVTPVGNALSIRDLGSRNGIYINGKQTLEVAALNPGDIVRLGENIGCVTEGVSGETLFRESAPGLWAGPSLALALAPAQKAAQQNIPLVIEGATGTGKERVARAVHLWSRRSGEYIAVNCAAIPTDLAESELFGHAKGAFTGADKAHLGYFRQANGGTLLLDEFLELSPRVQTKLLRVLEEKEVQSLGDSRFYQVDVRILAATQEPLSSLIASGQMRSDLAARLGVLTIKLPKLAERREDIIPLFIHFLSEQEIQPLPELDVELAEWLCLRPWTQNVRELQWLARAMSVLHGEENALTLDHLPPQYGDRLTDCAVGASKPSANDVLFQQLLSALESSGGNLKRAAEIAGIERTKAYRILKEHPDAQLAKVRRKLTRE